MHPQQPLTTSHGLDRARVEERLATIGLSAERLAALPRHLPDLDSHLESLFDDFYARVLAQPALATLISSDEQLLRLRAAQSEHARELFSPRIDLDYVERRLRVGCAHHHEKLPPQWYLMGTAILTESLVGWLLQRGAAADAETLLQRTLFDASLALDAYRMRAERELRSRDGGGDALAASAAPETVTGPAARESCAAPAPLARVRLTLENAELRRSFLGLGEPQIARLRRMAPTVERVVPGVLDAFYQFLSAHTATAQLVPDGVVARLREQVGAYWGELVRGAFDRPYAASRMRIGLVHERIGLSPQWYLAGLSRQFVSITRAVLAETDEAREDVAALLRAVFFDVSFVIDAYMEARAESVLRSEGYAARLVASLTAGVAVLDVDHRIQSVNRSLLDMIGVDPGLLQHMPAATAIPIPELPPLLRQLEQGNRPRVTTACRFRTRLLRVTAMRLEDNASGHGSGNHAAIVLDDVTDLQRMADDIDHCSSELEALVDAVPDVLWAVELPSWTVLSMSQQVLTLTGRRNVTIVGRADGWLSCLPEKDREDLRQRAATLTPGERAELEHRVQHLDGSVAWVLSRMRRLADQHGRVVVVGSSTDITALRNEREGRLRDIGQLAGGVAHELNNALTAAIGELQMLAPDSSREFEQGRERGIRACERATTVTRQLLAFARRQVLRARIVELGTLLRSFEPRLRAELGAGCSLHVQRLEQPVRCRIDVEQFEACLVQLTRNARAAMSTNGRLTISYHGAKDAAVVAVKDDGCGMSDEVAAHAVQPFYTTRPGFGAGLGLSMVHGFVAQSGGELRLRSIVGSGTTVELRLPLATAVAAASPALPQSRQPCLLVVEDDEMVRQVVRRIAAGVGFHVLDVPSAEAALELMPATTVDAILTDIMLGPGIDGLTLARRVRESHPGLPVLLTSGYSTAQFGRSDELMQFTLIEKPFSVPQLRATLAGLISSVRAAIARDSG